MASKAKPLNDELKKRFYPLVISMGFEKLKSSDPHFIEFRRQAFVGEDFFEVQWNKYWPPYFVLNFKKGGADDLCWSHGGRLQRKRGGSMSCWFSLRKPLLSKLFTLRWNYKPEEVVDELINAFEELEQWWKNGQIGPHIYICQYHA